MIPKKATAAIFLAFSVVVAFKHYLDAEYQYILLTLPFFVALITANKLSRILEITGLLASAVYIMACQVFHVGMILSVISSVFFFTLGVKLRTARIYIYSSTIIVGVCSYFQFMRFENMLLRSAFDAGIYAVLSFCVYIALQEYISANVKEAVDVAKEAIEIAKKEMKDGRR